ncbi:RidA family protein [Skermania sp. ID1734]|uniref:RidA family protein n=1 Tax=Skermania sp. ID1734 TaxID=2597516 RepID=UPI0011809A68|nr:RidA family protein [Skermania sp. ID1734]TSE01863.1 RidA family protein [Skermania sp. ID1734]
MVHIEAKIAELGFVLPPEPEPPPGFQFSFDWVRLHGDRVYVSGHGPQADDGSLCGPFGPVPSRVSVDHATDAARLTALSMLGSLQRALGDLDRIAAWLMVRGYVNADNDFPQSTVVINGFSDCILSVFGARVGAHARTAVGVTGLPMDNCVIVSAELALEGPQPLR